MGFVVAAVVIALIAFFAFKGWQAAKRERAEAPAHLKAAQKAFEEGRAAEALRELAQAFFEADHYTAEEARLELQVVELAESIARQRGTNLQDVTAELKQALEAAVAAGPGGADVVTDHSATFKKFITAAGKEPDRLVDALQSATTRFLTVDLRGRRPALGGRADRRAVGAADQGRPDHGLRRPGEGAGVARRRARRRDGALPHRPSGPAGRRAVPEERLRGGPRRLPALL
ncbi:MAG: hypothetical protein QM765_30970 [Myxococcales bacterium]